MTIEEAKNQLPVIRVKYQGNIHHGYIRGRQLAHAIAWLPDADKEITVAWATVARIVTNGTILQA